MAGLSPRISGRRRRSLCQRAPPRQFASAQQRLDKMLPNLASTSAPTVAARRAGRRTIPHPIQRPAKRRGKKTRRVTRRRPFRRSGPPVPRASPTGTFFHGPPTVPGRICAAWKSRQCDEILFARQHPFARISKLRHKFKYSHLTKVNAPEPQASMVPSLTELRRRGGAARGFGRPSGSFCRRGQR